MAGSLGPNIEYRIAEKQCTSDPDEELPPTVSLEIPLRLPEVPERNHWRSHERDQRNQSRRVRSPTQMLASQIRTADSGYLVARLTLFRRNTCKTDRISDFVIALVMRRAG